MLQYEISETVSLKIVNIIHPVYLHIHDYTDPASCMQPLVMIVCPEVVVRFFN